MRVCIVDDNGMDAVLMQGKLLSMQAFTNIQLMEHAEDVINNFESFDLIITSNTFGPGVMTGCEAIQRIREQERQMSTHTPVVIALWARCTRGCHLSRTLSFIPDIPVRAQSLCTGARPCAIGTSRGFTDALPTCAQVRRARVRSKG